MTPKKVNPIEWVQSVEFARQACAKIFRDGGAPADALKSFGVASDSAAGDWSRAIELIADAMCSHPAMKRAA